MNRFLFIFFITLATCQAQSIYRSDNYLLFKEAKSSKAVLIIKDSLLFKGNPLVQKTFSHSPYEDYLKNYLPIIANNKNYLVYNGCGAVLEWSNDSLKRVDHSFLHKNQYRAVAFSYKNMIYFWGGYGLFTHKNILTVFNLNSKEWDEVETFGTPPSPRRQAHGILIGDDLYVFSGFEKAENKFQQINACEPSVWKLNLLTMHWSEIGKYNSKININSKESTAKSFSANDKLYIVPVLDYNNVHEIDFKNNTITTFNGSTKNVFHPYYDSKSKEVVYVNKNADDLYYLVRTPIKEFLGKQVSQQAFILPWYLSLNPTTVILVVLSVVLVLILMLYVNKRKSRFVPFNGITFHQTTAVFYYRGKPLDTLDDAELRILDYLVQNRHRFISLNELNHLYENEIQSDNFTTVVKRREVALSSLLAKLIFIMNSTEQDILVYRRSANDKRVKEIKLKDSFIKVK